MVGPTCMASDLVRSPRWENSLCARSAGLSPQIHHEIWGNNSLAKWAPVVSSTSFRPDPSHPQFEGAGLAVRDHQPDLADTSWIEPGSGDATTSEGR